MGHVNDKPKHNNACGFSPFKIAMSPAVHMLCGEIHRYSPMTGQITKVTAMTQRNVLDLRSRTDR